MFSQHVPRGSPLPGDLQTAVYVASRGSRHGVFRHGLGLFLDA